MKRHAVLATIREAWSGAAYPGDDNLAGRNDGCGEYAYVSDYFRGKRWDELTLEHLLAHYEGPHYACMSFMSAEAYAYYLGSMMILAVEHPEDTIMDSVLFDLTKWWLGPGAAMKPGGVPDTAALWTIDRWERLTESQARAVLSFLEYARNLFEERGWDTDEPERAVETWRTGIPTIDRPGAACDGWRKTGRVRRPDPLHGGPRNRRGVGGDVEG